MEASSPSQPPGLASLKASVLVVDDIEDNREVLAARLAALGVSDVTMAADGREALALIARRPFDLVLLDLMMPNISGIEVLEALRRQGRLESLPVIMVSASDEIAGVVRSIELGAEDYLTKPVNATLLRARIGATLEKKGLRDALRARLAQADHDLLTARELARGMVPADYEAPDGAFTLHLLLEPARHVGGDLCDYFSGSDGSTWFAIGDVSGKGAAAAIFMARTWACLRAISMREGGADLSPGEVVTAMNQELCAANASSMFTTLFVGRLDRDSGRVAFANAGHIPPLHLDRDGNGRPLETPLLPPVGAWPDVVYPTGEVRLAEGDALFAYSDGLTEAMRAGGEQFGDERLRANLAARGSAMDDILLAALLSSVLKFSGDEPQTDDIAMLMLRWKKA